MSKKVEMKHFPGFPKVACKILNSFCKALTLEKLFLKDQGGRRYKFNNGRFLGKLGVSFVYSVNVESELFLSDDAPITVWIGSEQYSGKIVSCEGFEILASLESKIDCKKISGFISVEPWKLIESLVAKLYELNSSHSVAYDLVVNGPQLGTNQSIDSVAIGQTAAIGHAFGDEAVTVIWGPPGTGKTHTMAEIAIRFLNEGKTVLAVSHSNISVDGIALKVAELMRARRKQRFLSSGSVLRFGHVRDETLFGDRDVVSFNYALKKNPQIEAELKELFDRRDRLKANGAVSDRRRIEVELKIKELCKRVHALEQECVSNAMMVATTASRVYVNSVFEEKKYDVVLFDEVSMAYIPQVICASMFAKEKIICVGDFRQLSPIAQGKNSKDVLSLDLFHYLNICDKRQVAHHHPWLVLLNEQRRMHPDIAVFPSKQFYGALLKNHPSVFPARKVMADRSPFPTQATVLIDIGGMYCTAGKNRDNSRFNILSAIVSLGLALQAECESGFEVGIITPYAAQVRLLRSFIKDYRSRKCETNVSCATVHQFQGSERDVIIIDLVESRPSNRPGILMSDNKNGSVSRLVNVAMTRARGKLIAAADKQYWLENTQGRNDFSAMVEHLDSTANPYKEFPENVRELLKGLKFGPCISFLPNFDDATRGLVHDIEHASQRISFVIPDGNLVHSYSQVVYDAIIDAKVRGVEISLKCFNWTALPHNWQVFGWQSDDATCPIVVIDGDIAWYGVPAAEGRFTDSHGKGRTTFIEGAFRIRGKSSIDMISSLVDLNHRIGGGQRKALGPQKHLVQKDEEGRGSDGLAAYVSSHKQCPKCDSSMSLCCSKRGKWYIRCASCGERAYLEASFVNHYICVKQVKCPKCLRSLMSSLDAKVGPYGLFITCERHHKINPDEI